MIGRSLYLMTPTESSTSTNVCSGHYAYFYYRQAFIWVFFIPFHILFIFVNLSIFCWFNYFLLVNLFDALSLIDFVLIFCKLIASVIFSSLVLLFAVGFDKEK
jgi:hypothetical protein